MDKIDKAPMLMSNFQSPHQLGSQISGTDRNKVNVIPASFHLYQSAILSHIPTLNLPLGSLMYNFYLKIFTAYNGTTRILSTFYTCPQIQARYLDYNHCAKPRM
jgi:hypothetical protein